MEAVPWKIIIGESAGDAAKLAVAQSRNLKLVKTQAIR